MKQGMLKKLPALDKHQKPSWKKRDEGRKGKQEAYAKVGTWVHDGHGIVPVEGQS